MENIVSNNTTGLMPVAIVGEAIAGEAAQTLKQVKALIKGLSSNTFDLAQALYKVKKNKYYAPKFLTFSEYAKDLDIRLSKCYYLVKLVEVMESVGVPREAYEPVGIAKLRSICRIELTDQGANPKLYEGIPAAEVIRTLVYTSSQYTPESMDERVKEFQGLMGDDAMVWLNISLKAVARKRWEQAVALAQKLIGSVSKDSDGIYHDASVGRCVEIIAENYLQDPNNYPEGEEPNVQTADIEPKQ